MFIQVDRQQTDLKISWDYQKDLRETWKNNTRPSIYVDASTAELVRLFMEGPAMMCDKNCGVQVEFKHGMRDENGVRIPYEVRTGLKHDCPNTYPYECRTCGKLIYLDKKIRIARK